MSGLSSHSRKNKRTPTRRSRPTALCGTESEQQAAISGIMLPTHTIHSTSREWLVGSAESSPSSLSSTFPPEQSLKGSGHQLLITMATLVEVQMRHSGETVLMRLPSKCITVKSLRLCHAYFCVTTVTSGVTQTKQSSRKLNHRDLSF